MLETTSNQPAGEHTDASDDESPSQLTAETPDSVERVLSLLEQMSITTELLQLANSVFDNQAIDSADKKRVIKKAKERLESVLKEMTNDISERAGLPGLTAQGVLGIKTDRDDMVQRYSLSPEEIHFINGYHYVRNTLDNLTQDLIASQKQKNSS